MLQRETFMIHPYPYQLFAYLVGFVIIFRTQQSYGRFWEGRTSIQQMSSKWIDSVVMTLAFDRPTKYKDKDSFREHFEFAYELTEYLSLLHAVAMMDVRMDTNMENLRFERMPDDEEAFDIFFNAADKSRSSTALGQKSFDPETLFRITQ